MKSVTKTSIFAQKNHRRIKVFFTVFVLTSIIWLLIELSKTSTSTVQFQINYENIPESKLLQNSPIKEVGAIVKAPGFSLLSYKIRDRRINFDLNDMKLNNSVFYLVPNAHLSKINSQLPGDIEVMNVLKDSIFLDIGNKRSKRVVIKPDLELNFSLGFNLVEAITLDPDSIEISGPEKMIDTIFELTTNKLVLNDINKAFSEKLAIDFRDSDKNMSVSSKSVVIKGNVDKFTEGRLTLPVNFINEPQTNTLNPFPKEIEVTYLVGISNFNKIDKSSFNIVFDYLQYEKDTLAKFLTPVVLNKSDLISSLKIYPNQIEFLIQN